ncbi:ATP-binding protein [Streptomyces rapamycinicus]|uniref:ATP-binding protein n=1 Tax=Streptomyces rapamycinicus TaxID=1226757 RepID=UPI0032D93D42
MTHTFTAPTVQVRVDHRSAVHLAAEAAREVARACGLPGALPDQAAVIASELATNLDKHANDGTLYVQPLPLGHGVEILAADRGPGMHDPERCLTDGYTTSGTLGVGLGAVKRMATHFQMRSADGTHAGTWACARLTAPGGQRPGWQGWVRSVCPPRGRRAAATPARSSTRTPPAPRSSWTVSATAGPPPRRPRRRCVPSTPTRTGRCRRCSPG